MNSSKRVLSILALFEKRFSLAILRNFCSQKVFADLFGPISEHYWADELEEAEKKGRIKEIQENSFIYEIDPSFSSYLKEQLACGFYEQERSLLKETWVKIYAGLSRQFLGHLQAGKTEAAINAAAVEEPNLLESLRWLTEVAQESRSIGFWGLAEVIFQYLESVYTLQNRPESIAPLRQTILASVGTNAAQAEQAGGLGIWKRVVASELFDGYQQGMAALEKKEWLPAAERFQEAYQGFMKIENERQAAVCAHNLGMALTGEQEWLKAEAWCKTGLEICQRISDVEGEAQALYQLGKISEKQERFDEADNFYQQAIEFRERAGEPVQLITAYAQYGRFSLRYQRWDASITCQAKALSLASQLGHEHYRNKILKNLQNTKELMTRLEGKTSFENHWQRLIKSAPPV